MSRSEVKARLESLGWNATRLSKVTGIPYSSAWRILNEERALDAEDVYRIEVATQGKVRLEDFMAPSILKEVRQRLAEDKETTR